MDTYSSYVSTEYPPDFEKLVKKAEYEITEQLRAIQDELQIISGLQDQNEKKVTEIAKYEDLINELNTDAGNLYSQFKQNGEIAASLKRATSLLEHHEEHLQKELSKTRDFHEEIRKSNNEVIRKYSTKWDEYQERYDTFPLTKKVNALKLAVNDSNCTVKDLETQIETLTLKITKSKLNSGDKEEQLKMITKHIIDLSIVRMETKKSELAIVKNMGLMSQYIERTKRELEKRATLDQKSKTHKTSICEEDEAPPIVHKNKCLPSKNVEESENRYAEKLFLQHLALQEKSCTDGSVTRSPYPLTPVRCVIDEQTSQKQPIFKDGIPSDEKSPINHQSTILGIPSTEKYPKARPQLFQFIKSPSLTLNSDDKKYSSTNIQDDLGQSTTKSKIKMPQFYLSPKVGSPGTKKLSPPCRRDNIADGEITKSKIPRIEAPKFSRPCKEKADNGTPKATESEGKIQSVLQSKVMEETAVSKDPTISENKSNRKQAPLVISPSFLIGETNHKPLASPNNGIASDKNALRYQEKENTDTISYVDLPPDDMRLSDFGKSKDAKYSSSPDNMLGVSPNSHAKKISELNKSPTDGFMFASRPMFDGSADLNGNLSETGFFRMEESDRSFFGGEKSLFSFGGEDSTNTSVSASAQEHKSPGGIFGSFGDCQENKADSWSPFGQNENSDNQAKTESRSFAFSFNSQVSSPDTNTNTFSLFSTCS